MTISPIRAAFTVFLAAQEVPETLSSFDDLLTGVLKVQTNETRNDLWGLEIFEILQQHAIPTLSFRQKRVFEQLADAVSKRKSLLETRKAERNLDLSPKKERTKVLVSGAGPIGLRCAIENLLLGMDVTLVEKRSSFSRVNILLLWQCTADDLLSLGAKCFYPEWKKGTPSHMGTREIQLTLLKTALLFGARVRYESSLVGMFATSSGWNAVVAHSSSASFQQSTLKREGILKRTSRRLSAALDFKQSKSDDYQMTYHCNAVDVPEVNEEFIQAAKLLESPGNSSVAFDAFVIAEGERSNTSRALGFVKTVDKFSQAIGMVINMKFDKGNKLERIEEFTTSLLSSGGSSTTMLSKLEASGLKCENIEYLRGVTHYFVLTIKKSSLIEYGVVKEDKTGAELLSRNNLDASKLFAAARAVANVAGLPKTTEFFPVNPIQIFDFSSRARSRQSVKLLVAPGPTSPPKVYDTLDVTESDDVIPGGAVLAAVFPIGDALLEPFWPQGLGSNRGIHGAIDAAFSILCLDQEGRQNQSSNRSQISKEQALACMLEREFAYATMNVLAWKQGAVLTPYEQWSADPVQRYQGPIIETARDIGKKISQPLPQRILELPCQGVSMVAGTLNWPKQWDLGRSLKSDGTTETQRDGSNWGY